LVSINGLKQMGYFFSWSKIFSQRYLYSFVDDLIRCLVKSLTQIRLSCQQRASSSQLTQCLRTWKATWLRHFLHVLLVSWVPGITSPTIQWFSPYLGG